MALKYELRRVINEIAELVRKIYTVDGPVSDIDSVVSRMGGRVIENEDASKLIYNDESLEKALPKPWESEKNIWLFLQDHQEPKWRKLIRKNHRIQEVWNQRTMLTVPL